MRSAYDADAIRAAEAPLLASLPDGTLMQRAATALARRCAALLGHTYGAHVVVLAGSGNNGGDALFAGAKLARRGSSVTAILTGDTAHEAALTDARTAGVRVVEAASAGAAVAAAIAAADLVVDGILGIGATGALRPPQADLARLVSESTATVVAVDVPSGVDASTGVVDGDAVRADVTVTFGALKPGLVVAPGAEFAGVVEVVDIGLDLAAPTLTLLDADDVAALLPRPHGETDKYRRGVVGVAAGSDTYTGAAVLAVGGALATGAGMVRYAGLAHPAELVRRQWPEAVVTVVEPTTGGRVVDAGRVQSWVVGSGLGTDDYGRDVVRVVLASDVPVVVDADAITIVAEEPDLVRRRTAPTVLTPHAGEFARLVGADRADVEAHRLDHVRRAAAELAATVLLKGSTSVIADPDGQVRVNSADTAYLATAGSGDVLSGICGALLAGGLDAPDAAAAGAFLHGMAGLVATGEPAAPIVAMDIVGGLSRALRILGG